MHYALHVGCGNETKVEESILHVLPEGSYSGCFHVIRRRQKKIRGEWQDSFDNLIPGYVFLVTDDIEDVYIGMRKVLFYKRILGRERHDGGSFFVPLPPEEEAWIEVVTGDTACRMGAVYTDPSFIEFDEYDRVRVIDGPLKNLTGLVKRIDRHKRIAEVTVPFMGDDRSLYLGIEFLEKKTPHTV